MDLLTRYNRRRQPSFSETNTSSTDGETLPGGFRISELQHAGWNIDTRIALQDLALQASVAHTLKQMGGLQGAMMDPALGNDPELLATLFVAQFAEKVPEPSAAGTVSGACTVIIMGEGGVSIMVGQGICTLILPSSAGTSTLFSSSLSLTSSALKLANQYFT